MIQVGSSISEKLDEMLGVVCEATGESKSGLIREYIRRGVYQDLEGLNKYEVYKGRIGKGEEPEK